MLSFPFACTVAQQRDLGRLDEILVLNEQGSRLVVAGPKASEPAVQKVLALPEAGESITFPS